MVTNFWYNTLMSLTATEEARLRSIEAKLTEVIAALQNVGSKRQLTQLLAVLQKENADLKERIETLESQVALLKSTR